VAKTITLSVSSWHLLQEKIVEDYGRTTLLISWRLRDTLGFTVRQHSDYSGDGSHNWNTIRLDFWNDQMQTMFLLKYSDYLNSEHSPDHWQ
jgi:hypothetical protein